VEVSDRTRRRSDRNEATPGLYKKYRRMLQKAYGKHPTNMPKYYKIIQKDEAKLTLQLTHLRTLYKNPNDRRGLINAIRMISKILFGTMDTDDAGCKRTTGIAQE